MADTFLLIHSPLVGPYTWQPVKVALQSHGHTAITPTLLDVLYYRSNFASVITGMIQDQIQGEIIKGGLYLILHSAVGAFVSAVRDGVTSDIDGYIFIDARLPKDQASLSSEDSPEIIAQRRRLAKDGKLPRWSDWYSPQVMKEVLPEEKIRHQFLAELRSIPLSFFEEPLELGEGWPDASCGYIRLSDAYSPQARRAREFGWPVVEKNGGHLDMLVRPEEVASMVLEMARQLKNPPRTRTEFWNMTD